MSEQDTVTIDGITGRFVESWAWTDCDLCCFKPHKCKAAPCGPVSRNDHKLGHYELVSSVPDMPNIPPPPPKRMKFCIDCRHIIRRTDGTDSPRCGAIDRGCNPVDGSAMPRWFCEICRREGSGPEMCGRDGALFEAREQDGGKA